MAYTSHSHRSKTTEEPTPSAPPYTRKHAPHFNSLTNAKMQSFASILRNYPHPYTPNAATLYHASLRDKIPLLPRPLRAIGPHKPEDPSTGRICPGYLCTPHKGLKKGLCYETWAWIQRELDFKIGRVIYPVLMHEAALTDAERLRARHCEPVIQMYRKEFDEQYSAPPGQVAVRPGVVDRDGRFVPRYGYQQNQCPACLLARMGSDVKALVALMAGMVARFSEKRTGTRENVVSKRVKFVKYWLEAHGDGKTFVDEAWTLGRKMRKARRTLRNRPAEKAGESNGENYNLDNSSDAPFDLSEPFHPGYSLAKPVVYSQAGCKKPFDPTTPKEGSYLQSGPALGRKYFSYYDCPAGYRPAQEVGTEVKGRDMTMPDPSLGYFKNPRSQRLTHASGRQASIASSFTSGCSWDRLQEYYSEESEGVVYSRPTTSRMTNTPREEAREQQMLPRPHERSMYGEFGRPSPRIDTFAAGRHDLSPLPSPVSAAGHEDSFEYDSYLSHRS